MPAKDHDIPLAFLAECFKHDGDEVFWRKRPREHFATYKGWAMWNARYPGTVAGCTNKGGYGEIGLTFEGRERGLKAHRIIFALVHGYWPPDQVDHQNGIEAGNGIDNLREATNAENSQNRMKRRDNNSGFPGVSWSEHKRKWKAQIGADPHCVYLGLFDTREEAFAAYCVAKAILHPFAPTPRGVSLPDLRYHRLRTAHHIVKAARRHGDTALELHAWDHFVAAL